jgi:uncharacterized protein YgiM (DUF1202 family)
MVVNKKYIIYGGIALLLLSGLLIAKKVIAKPSMPLKKRKGSVEVGSLEGKFVTPAEVRTQQGTRLRSDSNTNSKIIITYNKGVKLFVTGDKKECVQTVLTEKCHTWYRVNDESGRTGWVREDVVDIKIDTPNPFVGDEKTLDQQLAEWELYNI